jgi:predicted ester cyclase
MSDETKAIVRRLYQEVFDQGHLTVIDEIYAPDSELHLPGLAEDPYGPAPISQLVATIHATFPGIRVSIEDIVAEGDRVVARVTFHLPHDGQLLGIGPRHRLATWTRIDIFRLFRGKIIEQWADRDDVALFEQFGVNLPTSPPGVS